MIKNYLTPGTAEEAMALRHKHPDSFFIAGGSWINSQYSPVNPETVISLEKLGLSYIKREGNGLTVGAMTPLTDLAESKDIPNGLKQALGEIVNRNLLNQATVGGTVCTFQSWFFLTPALIALDAKACVLTEDGSEKLISVHDFFTNQNNGLLLDIQIPLTGRTCRFERFSRTKRSVALGIAAAAFEKKDGKIVDPIIVVSGIGTPLQRLTSFEQELQGEPLPEQGEFERRIPPFLNSADDYRGSAEYKKHLISVLVGYCFHKTGKL